MNFAQPRRELFWVLRNPLCKLIFCDPPHSGDFLAVERDLVSGEAPEDNVVDFVLGPVAGRCRVLKHAAFTELARDWIDVDVQLELHAPARGGDDGLLGLWVRAARVRPNQRECQFVLASLLEKQAAARIEEEERERAMALRAELGAVRGVFVARSNGDVVLVDDRDVALHHLILLGVAHEKMALFWQKRPGCLENVVDLHSF